MAVAATVANDPGLGQKGLPCREPHLPTLKLSASGQLPVGTISLVHTWARRTAGLCQRHRGAPRAVEQRRGKDRKVATKAKHTPKGKRKVQLQIPTIEKKKLPLQPESPDLAGCAPRNIVN